MMAAILILQVLILLILMGVAGRLGDIRELLKMIVFETYGGDIPEHLVWFRHGRKRN